MEVLNTNSSLNLSLYLSLSEAPTSCLLVSRNINKALYTEGLVACCWAGAVAILAVSLLIVSIAQIVLSCQFGSFSQTAMDGWTDRPTDRVAYRVACTRLKTGIEGASRELRGSSEGAPTELRVFGSQHPNSVHTECLKILLTQNIPETIPPHAWCLCVCVCLCMYVRMCVHEHVR